MKESAVSKPANPYDEAWKGFTEQTSDHELVVIHDDGLYRHLRVQAPGTRMWSWDVTTWPNHLATSGDIADGFMFTHPHEPDMLDFFDRPDHLRDYYVDGAPCIDVRYWAEKLCGGRSHDVKTYDSDLFLDQVREHLEESDELGTEAQEFRDHQLALLKKIDDLRRRYACNRDLPSLDERLEAHWKAEDAVAAYRPSSLLYSAVRGQESRDDARRALRELWSTDGLSQAEMDGLDDWFELADVEVPRQSPAARREEVLDDARWHSESEHDAHAWLRDNEDHVGGDTFEWDLREYDLHFLFACYAIDLTVQLYRRHTSAQPSPHTTQENTDA